MSAADDVSILAAMPRVQCSGRRELAGACRHAQRTLEAVGGLGGSSEDRLEGQALANAQAHARRCLESLRDAGTGEAAALSERARSVSEALTAGGAAAVEGEALAELRALALRCLECLAETAPLQQGALDEARRHARQALESLAPGPRALSSARAHAQRCLEAMEGETGPPLEALEGARQHARLALEGMQTGGLEAARAQTRLCLEAMAAVQTAGADGRGREGLCAFARWALFLPRAASKEVEQCGAYVKSRHSASKLFEDTRDGLQAIIDDLNVLHASCVPHRFSVEVLEAVLEAQRIAHGFTTIRSLHKAMALSELCLSLVDLLAARGDDPLLFWRVLTRTNLGDQYARFRRVDEARACMSQALALLEEGSGPREQCLGATCHAHLGRLHLGAEELEEAARRCGLAAELFEAVVWRLSERFEDREAQVAVLATAYSNCGVCAIRQLRHDEALLWLRKAEQLLAEHLDLGQDIEEILAHVREHTRRAQNLSL